jgi:hypothetical protein
MLEDKAVKVEEFEPVAFTLPVIESALQRYSTLRRRGFH